jgi:hypothetical protein
MTVINFRDVIDGDGKPLAKRLDEIELGIYDTLPSDVEPPVVNDLERYQDKPKNALTARLDELFRECLAVAKKKNADYASDDDPFANFNGCTKYGISVPKGMLVRMEDKMKRISNLLDKPASVSGESIYDSCLDLANYALILRAFLELEGPKWDMELGKPHGQVRD